ncbi:rRNA pseudouridine synthase [candidate division WOR-3 bacterium]|nr:rRNA pseudouridine synthase [candidate division WOR-3 bacterium]
MKPERLQKYLASCGVGSRRHCEELIAGGRVRVNGVPGRIGQSVVPGEDRVEYRGREVRPEAEKVVVAVNKPTGYLSACFRGREEGWLVTELVDLSFRLYPVGRLDRDSEGLLLLTNDGDLALELTHPRYGKEKEYDVELDRPAGTDLCERLRRSVQLSDGPARAVRATLTGPNHLSVVLAEGRKRQLRRMLEALGCRVVRLRRVRIAGLRLGDLPLGKWRRLTEKEVKEKLGRASTEVRRQIPEGRSQKVETGKAVSREP